MGKINFKPKIYSQNCKIAAIALLIITLPLTVVLVATGIQIHSYSISYKRIYNLYMLNQSTHLLERSCCNFSKERREQEKPGSVSTKTSHNKVSHSQPTELKTEELSEHAIIEITCQPRLQERRFPPASLSDTVQFSPAGIFSPIRGNGELFLEREIIERLKIIREVEIGTQVFATFTHHNKAIIQQQAQRGCTAAAAAMLIMDNGKEPNLNVLRSRNLGNNNDQVKDIERAGLKAVLNFAPSLSELRRLIFENGSAIACLRGKLDNHVVVVDEVSGDLEKIRLRDPYHGWEITVSYHSFVKEWPPGYVTQVMKE